MVMALVLIGRGWPRMSALSLAIGINTKYFPVVLLIPILSYLKKGRISYAVIIGVVSVLVNAPFMFLTWTGWFQQAVLFQLTRQPGGYSLYNLLTGQLWGGPSEVGLVLPLALLVSIVAFYGRREKLPEMSANFMTVTVLFNRVVLWYAQWFVPLVVLCYRQVRRDTLLIAAFFLSQVLVYAGATMFGNQLGVILTIGWLYQTATAILAWRLSVGLLSDRSSKQPANCVPTPPSHVFGGL